MRNFYVQCVKFQKKLLKFYGKSFGKKMTKFYELL